jgi:hypothetical protein
MLSYALYNTNDVRLRLEPAILSSCLDYEDSIMIKVYIPLKDGQALSHEVMQGLINNNCVAAPITTKGGKEFRETNKNNNILRALEQCQELKEDYFILMDSDVILSDAIVFEVFDERLNLNVDIVSIATDRSEHGLVFFKKNAIHKFEAFIKKRQRTIGKEDDNYSNCSLCMYLTTPGNLNIMIQNENVKEVTREDGEELTTYMGGVETKDGVAIPPEPPCEVTCVPRCEVTCIAPSRNPIQI